MQADDAGTLVAFRQADHESEALVVFLFKASLAGRVRDFETPSDRFAVHDCAERAAQFGGVP